MARIRSIKPEFFLHEEMAEMPPLHRLLFIGLWTLADKEGRLEDRPRRIKAALFPWERCDVDKMLAELDAGGFIQRYETQNVEAPRCIHIPGFAKHQRPHPKESGLGLPPPPPKASREEVRSSREIKRQAVEGFSTIPSCPAGKEISVNGKEILESGKESPAEPDVPALQAAWNELKAPEQPRWVETPKTRENHAETRLKERPSLAEWRDIIRRIAASPFCRGNNDRGWIAGPDFLLRPETATKALEGAYDGRAPPSRAVDLRKPMQPSNWEGVQSGEVKLG